ncbi:RAMP superfamily CRISPR-associated protein [Rhodococcus ruber]|uniref:RAMP superfamily CRISPR-associated protein n=1 Tax=Rhodococcus ruber TaxID=1830 RepID=UPI000C79ED28|nr:RAMP superfamily CRISPR-associated protein [Rhodococcus ruber]AUM20267.1 hypothetical protein CSW53_27260 [Rhodococcus ruber]
MTVEQLRRQLAGAGGVPAVRTAVRIRGHVHVLSDTTIGGDESDQGADTRLDRDTVTGRPKWAGTGQAGALRHHLAAVLGDEYAARVFGDASADSPFRSTESLAYGPDGGYPPIDVRRGNHIDAATGVGVRGAVFTDEVLTAGAVFPVDWSVHAGADHLVEATAGFVRAVDGIRDESICLGLRRGKGRGAISATGWTVERHDLGTPGGFRSWHTRDRVPGWVAPEASTDLVAELDALIPGVAERVRQLRAIDLRKRLMIRMTLAVAELVHPGHDKPRVSRAATMVQSGTGRDHREDGALARAPLTRPTGTGGALSPVDSGTALHSMLKRHTGWVLHAIANSADDPGHAHHRADEILEALFGTIIRAGRRPATLRPSRVSVTESAVAGSSTVRLPHVRLNPLTQGAVDSALFFEDVLVGGHSEITVTVTRPRLHELGALAWVLRDLRDGVVSPMGAATTNGHGRRLLTAAALDVPAGVWGSEPHRFATLGDYAKSKGLRQAAAEALKQAVQKGHP